MTAPRWVVRLLNRAIAPHDHDDIIGDLEELHGRRVARWGRATATAVTAAEGLGLAVMHAFRRTLRAVGPGSHWFTRSEVLLSLRLIRKQPIMTATSVLALGAGIGMVAGAFSIFQQGLFSDLPFPDGDRWVVVETYAEESANRSPLDLERLGLFRSSAPAFAYLAGAESDQLNVVHTTGEVERVAGARVTPGTFRYLPYVPVAGRLFTVEDGAPDAPPTALIRESLWTRRYSGSPDILGRSIDIAGTEHVVVGVLPDHAGYPSEGEIWIAMPEATLGATGDRGAVGSRLIGILADGATLEQATEQVNRLSTQVAASGRGAERQRHRVTPITRTMVSPQIQVMIGVFMTVLTIMLLIIAANVTNLVVARTSQRTGELAVRTALGASRSRIVGQLLVEALSVGALAALLGLTTAGAILRLYDRILDEMPFWVQLRLEPSTAIVVALLALMVSGLMGVLPALRVTRGAPGDGLRSAGRGAALGVSRVGTLMIAAEVALSVALLGTAVVFARGFQLYVNPAFHLPDDRVLTARIVMDLEEPDSITPLLRSLERTLAAMPEVSAVGIASHLPRESPYPEPLQIENSPDLVPAPVVWVGADLFDVLEVEPVVGRGIRADDMAPGAPAVVVVNEAFATQTYGTTQVLGRRLRLALEGDRAAPGAWHAIVGVVPNVMEVAGPIGAAGVYYPLEPRRFLTVALAVEGIEPLALTGRLRQVVYDLDPTLNLSEIVRLDDVGAENRSAMAVMSSSLTGIGIITLLLSLAGVYSIVSLAVTRKTREIGVRVALGAKPEAILWSVLRASTFVVVAGAALGAFAGYQGSRVQLFVFAVPEAGWWLFPGLVVLMGLAGLGACWVPARRALSIQPIEAMRYEG